MEKKNKDKFFYGFSEIWLNFTIALGCIMLVVLISNILSPVYYPIVSLILAFTLFSVIRQNRDVNGMSCYLLLFISARVLLQYTIIALILDCKYYIYGQELLLETVEIKSLQVSYFPILLLSPLLLINTIFILIRKSKFTFCTYCLLRNGAPSERGYAGKLQSDEMKRLIKQIIIISIIMTVSGWSYYIFLYNTSNINRYDKLIFNALPVALWVVHEFSFGIRCWVLSAFVTKRQKKDRSLRQGYTLLRFLVICDDEIFVRNNDTADSRIDISTVKYVPYCESVMPLMAKLYIEKMININSGKMRLLYDYIDKINRCGIIHYIYVISDNDRDKLQNGTWMTVTEIENAFTNNKLSGVFKAEIYKLHTTLLAQKTYSVDGKRLHPIKNYRPLFSFKEILTSEADFSNPMWMLLSVQNEDNKFYKLKKWWFKYIEGLVD